MRSPLLLVLLILQSIWPLSAQAHPHVFIENRVRFLMAGSKVTGFRTEWRFDEIFTEDLLSRYDADGDKQFSPSESELVRDGTLPNLAAFRYFTYAYLGGQDLGEMEPVDFKADIVDGAARFIFVYSLPLPVDLLQERFALSVYDQEYYVEVLLAQKDSVTIEGTAGASCNANIAEDPEHAYFGGFVIPQIVTVVCQ